MTRSPHGASPAEQSAKPRDDNENDSISQSGYDAPDGAASAGSEGSGAALNTVGCAEAEVGRYVYRRIEALMDAEAGTPDGDELLYLSTLAESVEEYGEEACAGTALATAPVATDLLAELKRVVAMFDPAGIDSDLNSARAAIAKALSPDLSGGGG